jgi:hypothetical protein
MSPHCEEVIIADVYRGKGTQDDPGRRVLQVFQKDGTFLAEHDPCTRAEDDKDGRLLAEALLRRVLQCDKNANILNGAPDVREAILRLFDPKPL